MILALFPLFYVLIFCIVPNHNSFDNGKKTHTNWCYLECYCVCVSFFHNVNFQTDLFFFVCICFMGRTSKSFPLTTIIVYFIHSVSNHMSQIDGFFFLHAVVSSSWTERGDVFALVIVPFWGLRIPFHERHVRPCDHKWCANNTTSI